MSLTKKTQSIQGKQYGSTNLSTVILTQNDSEFNPSFRHESSETNRLSHGTVSMHTNINVEAFWKRLCFLGGTNWGQRNKVTSPHTWKVLDREHLAIFEIVTEKMTFHRWREKFRKYDTLTFTKKVQGIRQNQVGGRSFWTSKQVKRHEQQNKSVFVLITHWNYSRIKGTAWMTTKIT
jgi:hypothetical protein